MKFRRQHLPPVPPQSVDNDEIRAAQYIALAVNQGMPGNMFCDLVHTIDAQKVEDAAALTVHQLIDWFKADAGARQILDQVPRFPEFTAAFHQRAQELYPPRSKQQ